MKEQREITKIQLIQDVNKWAKYLAELKILRLKNEGIQDNVKLLWHGTRYTDPQLLIAKETRGFDSTYAPPGYWGKGFYACVNADYSHGYRFDIEGKNRQA